MNDETFRGNRQGANFSTGSNTTDGRLTARATVKGQTNRDLRMRDDGASDGAKIVLEDVRTFKRGARVRDQGSASLQMQCKISFCMTDFPDFIKIVPMCPWRIP